MAFPKNVDGTWVNSGASYDAGELRRADAALFASAGVTSGLTVSVDGADVVTVQPGSVVISGEDAVTGTGVYRAGLAAAETGSLTARHATNARIDLVVFRQMDTDVVPAHGAYTSRIEIIAGTPSATPVVPTKPSMAVELARINVPASGGGAASVNSANRVSARAAGVPATGVPVLARGQSTQSTSAGGAITLVHNLGVVPTAVFVDVQNSQRKATADLGTASTTTITVYVRSLVDGSLVTSSSNNFQWLAVA